MDDTEYARMKKTGKGKGVAGKASKKEYELQEHQRRFQEAP